MKNRRLFEQARHYRALKLAFELFWHARPNDEADASLQQAHGKGRHQPK
jgi:hypothetical protein